MDGHSFFEIEQLRERLGVKQSHLCRSADVSETTYTKAKRGKLEPTPRIRKKLSQALLHIQDERGLMIVEKDLSTVGQSA